METTPRSPARRWRDQLTQAGNPRTGYEHLATTGSPHPAHSSSDERRQERQTGSDRKQVGPCEGLGVEGADWLQGAEGAWRNDWNVLCGLWGRLQD